MSKNPEIKKRAIKKALSSSCRYNISALGFNRRGELIGSCTNTPRFVKLGGGNHAEMLLMKQSSLALHTIVLCRVNSNGDLLPIEPCQACQRKADELNIKIVTLEE